ncbi:GH116 family glycosyl-hydrolase [Paenibacillus sp. IITD108]|uniref:GH116 family glycosyl-hydrolase n=1 Tax=Paenibacillus sp. IITD108 TaxID=3116649 RepID=UPI002F3E43FC
MTIRYNGAVASEAAFLLGGIGTGNVSIGSRGEFRDWEIFNKPEKGLSLPNTFFSIRALPDGGKPISKILERRIRPPYSNSHGYHPYTGAGLPRMKESTMEVEYPFVRISFEDDELPVSVSMEAYTPFIPLNCKDSSLPGTVLTYTVTNKVNESVEITLAGSIMNPIGDVKFGQFGQMNSPNMARNINDFREECFVQGLFMRSENHERSSLYFGNMALVTTWKSVTYKRAWLRGSSYEQLQQFWEDFHEDGKLEDLEYIDPTAAYQTDTGSLGVCHKLQPGESVKFEFILSWYFPNRINGWNDEIRIKREGEQITRNFYSNDFSDAWEVAKYIAEEQSRLKGQSLLFSKAMYDSSLPPEIIDAAMSNITVLRSTTCFRLSDGRFLGYEGTFNSGGCCEGNCTHVWNYAQTVAYLFPELEQSMRRIEFLEEVEDNGWMNFRAYKMFDAKWQMWGYDQTPPSTDGQLGSIMRVYREWKLSGDDNFLQELWPSMKKTLDFAFIYWDEDNDFVMEGKQHVTYDIDFYGANALTGTLLLGALKTSAEIATYLGDLVLASKYTNALQESTSKLHERLWNGEYYEQDSRDDEFKYQYGAGCLSDQLLGQQLAHLYGLGYLLPPNCVQKAVHSIYRYNFRRGFEQHLNCQRTYALSDESGLVLCSWPRGKRPRTPFIYSDEVWSGVEYQVATHLILEGYLDEGLELVQAVRERHDGIKRNPWNEVECGHHYVRSMASWGLILAMSGFVADLVNKKIYFKPIMSQNNFRTFWSMGRAWGVYQQWKTEKGGDDFHIEVLYGNADGITVVACGKELVL